MPLTRRTRTLLSWLPAALLVVIIGAIVVGTFTVQASWWAEDDPEASADQKASDGGSMLTDAGFDYVNVEGVLRVRVGEGALPTSDLGLRANETKDAEFRRPVQALIAAGDDVHVIDNVITASAVASADRLAQVTVGIDGAGSWRGAIEGLRARAAEFGWDAAQFEGLDERLLEFNSTGSGEVFEVQIGPGQDADTAVTATVTFSREGGATTVALSFAPPA